MKIRIESREEEGSSLVLEEDELGLEEFEETLKFLKHFSGRLMGTHAYIDSSRGTLVLHPAPEGGEGFQIVIPLKHVHTFSPKELEDSARTIFLGPTFVPHKPQSRP